MTYAQALAGLLMERRADLGIPSQRVLAGQVGVSEATVRRWERALSVPDAYELRCLADVLKVSAEQLLYPADLTAREREVLRRAARRAGNVRDPGGDGMP